MKSASWWLQTPQLILQDFRSVLLIFLLWCVLRRVVIYINHHLYSDLHSIPSPPVPLWKKYLVGHNVLSRAMLGDAHEIADILNSWRKKYGSILMIRDLFGDRNIIITSETAIRAFGMSRSSTLARADAPRKLLLPYVGPNGLLLAEGNQHDRLRKALAPAMHHDALLALGHIFLKEGKHLADQLQSEGESGYDIVQTARNSSYDVILQTCFGDRNVSKEVMKDLREAYGECFKQPPSSAAMTHILMALFPWIDPMVYTYRKDKKKYIRKTLTALCEEVGLRYKRGESDQKSPLLTLMKAESTEKAITELEMMETIQSLVLAGHATTAVSLCWTLYELAKGREWQLQLYDELKNWKDSDGLEALDQLPLLDRLIRESMRLHPPFSYVSRKTAQLITIDGYRIPKGVNIRVPAMAVQRCEEIWGSDSHEFNPDRFLDEGEVARTRLFWCAFMFGSRGCIGQRFALLELKAFVAQVIKRLDVYIKPLEDPAPGTRGILAGPKNLKLYFRPRQ